MSRLIDADALLKKTINNPLHAPYITEKDIREMPTIQHEERTEKRMKTHACDLISRHEAVDALDTAIEHYDGIAEECRKKADIERNDYMDMRDDAYEARQLAQWLNELKYLRKKIEQLTIKPEPQWIPCEERMPEKTPLWKTVGYLATVTCDPWEEPRTMYVKWETTTVRGKEVSRWTFDNRLFPSEWRVVAWMPMPEAYKEGGERI